MSFQLARHADAEGAALWIAKGDYVTKKMKTWNEHCSWNFEAKMLLLEAEKKSIEGKIEQAETLYLRSIYSASSHKFINDEAIASELAGHHFYERGQKTKSCSLFMHSVIVGKFGG